MDRVLDYAERNLDARVRVVSGVARTALKSRLQREPTLFVWRVDLLSRKPVRIMMISHSVVVAGMVGTSEDPADSGDVVFNATMYYCCKSRNARQQQSGTRIAPLR